MSPRSTKTNVANFMFATGIENSYPTIEGGKRIDEMDKCGHYERFEEDFDLVVETGCDTLRWGPPYYKTHTAPGRYDWGWTDEAIRALKARRVEVIADLCHFGVPDWAGDFQNTEWPRHFGKYAGEFARRYPHIRYYTPVNEIYITASFSALRGFWNEQLQDEGAFVRAIANLTTAHELAVEEILKYRPDAIFVQGESIENFHATGKGARGRVETENTLKHLALDLTLGLTPGTEGAAILARHGFGPDTLEFFSRKRAEGQRWIGLDYYATCEHRVASTGRTTGTNNPQGLAALATQYWNRYRVPLFHCETNRKSTQAVRWLAAQWEEIKQIRARGIPVKGFTWYSLTDQIDWQYALRVERNEVHDVGLYDLERRIRPVGQAYKRLIAAEREATRTTAA